MQLSAKEKIQIERSGKKYKSLRFQHSRARKLLIKAKVIPKLVNIRQQSIKEKQGDWDRVLLQ